MMADPGRTLEVGFHPNAVVINGGSDARIVISYALAYRVMSGLAKELEGLMASDGQFPDGSRLEEAPAIAVRDQRG